MGHDDLPLTSVSEVVYRYSNYDTPFWVRPNTRSGRWHRAGDGPTQYLSLSTEGAWAELIRSEELRTEKELELVRMPLWQASVDIGTVVDYSDFERAEEAGFRAENLVADDWTACQDEGRRLRGMGYAGVLSPSAALPGAVNLTIFGPKVAIRWDAHATLASAIPAQVLTVGSPPGDLLARVRYRGDPHVDLERFVKVRRKKPDS
jgi:RES domain-containing protein